jgi:hypothetical protein
VKKLKIIIRNLLNPLYLSSIFFNRHFHQWHWQTLSSLNAMFWLDDTSWQKVCWQWQFWQVVNWSGVKPMIFPSRWSSTDKVCVSCLLQKELSQTFHFTMLIFSLKFGWTINIGSHAWIPSRRFCFVYFRWASCYFGQWFFIRNKLW